MLTNLYSMSLEDGGNGHLLEMGIIVSNAALILVSIMLTIVTAMNDDAMVKIVRILHSRRAPAKRSNVRREHRSTEDTRGDERSADADDHSRRV